MDRALELDRWGSDVLALPTGCSLVLRNQTAGALLAVLEDVRWSDEATTAASVLELPEFRELFPTERPDLSRWRGLEPAPTEIPT